MFLKLLLPLCFAFVKTTDGAKGKGKTFSVLQTINDHKYEDVILLSYHRSSRPNDLNERFFESAKRLNYSKTESLSFSPKDVTVKNLLEAVKEFGDKNVLVLLLNPETSMINWEKTKLVSLKIFTTKRILIHTESTIKTHMGVQLVADSASLLTFLKARHNSGVYSLVDAFRKASKSDMEQYLMEFSDRTNDDELFNNFDIEYSKMSTTELAEFRLNLNQEIGIYVQNDPSNENAAAVLDNLFSLKFHPQIELQNLDEKDLPTVLIGITVDANAIFVQEFFDKIGALEYPRSKLDVYISCQSEKHRKLVKKIAQVWEAKEVFNSVVIEPIFKDIKTSREKIVSHAKMKTRNQCYKTFWASKLKAQKCLLMCKWRQISRVMCRSDRILFTRATCHLENANVLRRLVACDKNVVAPMLRTNDKMKYTRIIRKDEPKWANGLNQIHSFFRAAFSAGNNTETKRKYLSGFNYITVDELSQFWQPFAPESTYTTDNLKINNKDAKKGFADTLWRVKSIKDCYLVKTDILDGQTLIENSSNDIMDNEFSQTMLKQGFALHLLGDLVYGQIVNMMDLPGGRLHPELSRIFENHDLWERRYILPIVRESETEDPEEMPKLLPSETMRMGRCPDAYEVPLTTEAFCDHLVEESEHEKVWFQTDQNGTATFDARYNIYEGVPTNDVPMFQLDLEDMWLCVINFYLLPRKVAMFPSASGADRGGQFFIIRYRPEGQADLKPHEDNSLYSVNMALARPGIDFEGGGTRFIRYNCSVTDLPKGHLLVHPGRLTHYHEGLMTTKGTRYILISFVSSIAAPQCYRYKGQVKCDGQDVK